MSVSIATEGGRQWPRGGHDRELAGPAEGGSCQLVFIKREINFLLRNLMKILRIQMKINNVNK